MPFLSKRVAIVTGTVLVIGSVFLLYQLSKSKGKSKNKPNCERMQDKSLNDDQNAPNTQSSQSIENNNNNKNDDNKDVMNYKMQYELIRDKLIHLIDQVSTLQTTVDKIHRVQKDILTKLNLDDFKPDQNKIILKTANNDIGNKNNDIKLNDNFVMLGDDYYNDQSPQITGNDQPVNHRSDKPHKKVTISNIVNDDDNTNIKKITKADLMINKDAATVDDDDLPSISIRPSLQRSQRARSPIPPDIITDEIELNPMQNDNSSSKFEMSINKAIDLTVFKKDKKAVNQTVDKDEIKLYFKKQIKEKKMDVNEFQKRGSRKQLISQWTVDLELKKVSATRLHTSVSNIFKEALIEPRETERFVTSVPIQANTNQIHNIEIHKFTFGQYVDYWDPLNDDYLKQKYNNLKEEMISNKDKIELDVFNSINEKSKEIVDDLQDYLPDNCTAKHNASWNTLFQIQRGTLLSQNHLTALLLYTNSDDIQFNVKLKCRDAQNISEYRSVHGEYWNWLKLLKEIIMLYGDEYKLYNDKYSIRKLYHGISTKLLFNKFEAAFNLPLSTTTELNVAQNFCEDLSQGILIEFDATESYGQPYFDTSTVSAFPAEHEYLFFHCLLSISTIRYFDIDVDLNKIMNISYYTKSIKLFQCIMEGYLFTKKREGQSLLIKLIERKNQDISTIDDIVTSMYIYHLFNNVYDYYCNNQLIWFNQDEIQKYIKPELSNLIVNMPHKNAQSWQWVIRKNELQEFKNGKTKTISSDEHKLVYDINNNSFIKFFCSIQKRKIPPAVKTIVNNNSDNDNIDQKEEEKYECRLRIVIREINIPSNVNSIKFWFDMYCKECKYYIRNPPKIISTNSKIYVTMFSLSELIIDKNITFTFSIKCDNNN